MKNITTIRVHRVTLLRLKKHAVRPDQVIEDIIIQLMDIADRKKEDKTRR